ncbi:MAG TPA: NAD(P)-dependent oxidoreductase, partial [Tepidisphaeraceae bacterium]|nr:NAD(P)-dependent oxidoreductase [Tepidisphaeraceae bacterium]
RGATPADLPAAAAKGRDVVFICVTDTPDVTAVIEGEYGVAAAAHSGQIVVDHSTISPAETRRLAGVLAAKGAMLLDAPVSGGDIGARQGTLSIMVGGEAEAFARVSPLLSHMGKTITHCGSSGCGQLTKLVNQILVSVTNLAVCEAMSFAKKNGLDLQNTLAAVGGGAAGSWQLANLGPKMIAGDFRPGFMIDLQQKDLRLILQAAQESKSPMLAASLVAQLFSSAQAAGRGKEGTQALFAVLESLGGIEL